MSPHPRPTRRAPACPPEPTDAATSPIPTLAARDSTFTEFVTITALPTLALQDADPHFNHTTNATSTTSSYTSRWWHTPGAIAESQIPDAWQSKHLDREGKEYLTILMLMGGLFAVGILTVWALSLGRGRR